MNGSIISISTKVVELVGLSPKILLYPRCNKTSICAFSFSFIFVFTTLFIIVSIAFWHPVVDKFYEEDDEISENELFPESNLLDVEETYDYSPDLESRLYNGRHPIRASERAPYNGHDDFPTRRASSFISFLPEESDIKVSEDLIISKVPTIVRSSTRYRPKGTENEALSAVNLALKMKSEHKFEKALKLFRHALALQPLHPDVLNHYGEFLEEKEKDFIKADHMFLKALTVRPDHSRALVNRKRTLPVVKELDEKELKKLDDKHLEVLKLNHNNAGLNRLKKELFFQHIYHTVAIEGNTMTLEDTRMVVETGLPVAGISLTEHMEVVGVEKALRYIDNYLVRKKRITVYDILEVHKLVLGHNKPRIAGSFRETQVFVAEHTPPRAADVVYLMNEYVEWIQSYDFLQLHPVKQAALAHYKLVYIHPFIDGNGRTARLIMNMILMRYGYPPVVIRNNERNYYFRSLQIANEGDVRPFVRFIAHCTECTLDVYLYSKESDTTLEPIKWDHDDIIAL